MTIETLKNRLPDYAKDLKLNLSGLLNEDTLNDQQKYGTLLASALASRNATVLQDIIAEAEEKLSPEGRSVLTIPGTRLLKKKAKIQMARVIVNI